MLTKQEKETLVLGRNQCLPLLEKLDHLLSTRKSQDLWDEFEELFMDANGLCWFRGNLELMLESAERQA